MNPNVLKDGGSAIGMSFVVRSVGQATLPPADQPQYGTPAFTRSRMRSRIPASYMRVTSAQVFPPPTAMAFASRTAFCGLAKRWIETILWP